MYHQVIIEYFSVVTASSSRVCTRVPQVIVGYVPGYHQGMVEHVPGYHRVIVGYGPGLPQVIVGYVPGYLQVIVGYISGYFMSWSGMYLEYKPYERHP